MPGKPGINAFIDDFKVHGEALEEGAIQAECQGALGNTKHFLFFFRLGQMYCDNLTTDNNSFSLLFFLSPLFFLSLFFLSPLFHFNQTKSGSMSARNIKFLNGGTPQSCPKSAKCGDDFHVCTAYEQISGALQAVSVCILQIILQIF